jgi:pimeloyl-ACP methyl ester carboxylesterase
MAPRIRFVRGRQGHRLAVAVDGSGPPLVLPAWWVSHVERDVAIPAFRRFFAALAERHTVVRYDRAGVGLSDRERERFGLEDEAADLEAVVEQLGLGRCSIFAISCGAPTAVALAARRPALVERLVVFGGYLHGARIARPDVQTALVGLVRASWGLGSRALCEVFLPGAGPEDARQFAEQQKHAATAEMSARLLELTYAMDAREEAPRVTAPTVVLHRRQDRAIPFELGRELAAAIPGAELVALEGTMHFPWLGDASPVLAALGADAAPPPPAAGGDLVLGRDGDVWAIRYGGRTVHAKHSRGLADLALLVAHPGRRFHATELMHGEPAPRAGADPVLDGEARGRYRVRLEELDEAVAAALAADHPDRAARLEAERDAILGELRAATGLGGRRRALGDEGERARKAVTGRIRDSIARLAKLDAALGAHLAAAVETGTTCVYRPLTSPSSG